jgi:hypothetical protein
MRFKAVAFASAVLADGERELREQRCTQAGAAQCGPGRTARRLSTILKLQGHADPLPDCSDVA